MNLPPIDRARDALIIVDLQYDFLPGGALAVERGHEIIEPIATAAQKFDCVVATQDWHPVDHISFASQHAGKKPFEQITLWGKEQTLWPDHCVANSHGAWLYAHRLFARVGLVLRKGMNRNVDSYSAFRENWGPNGERAQTGLAAWLTERGIQRVFLCGLARDYCVKWSAEDAAHEFETHVLWPLTRAVAPQNDEQVADDLIENGITIHR